MDRLAAARSDVRWRGVAADLLRGRAQQGAQRDVVAIGMEMEIEMKIEMGMERWDGMDVRRMQLRDGPMLLGTCRQSRLPIDAA